MLVAFPSSDQPMTGLILELQRDSLDRNVQVGDVLRKLSLVAAKLDLKEVDEWIRCELSGYGDVEVPSYRVLHGEVKAFNPVRGWIPVVIGDNAMANLLSKRSIGQSIFEIEDLLASNASSLHVKYPASQQALLMKWMKVEMQPALHVTRQSLVRVVQTVRDRVKDLTLEWERRGISGDGLTFTREEKATASQIHYTTVTNIGEMHNSMLQQHSSGTQTLNAVDPKALISLADAVSAAIGQLKLAADDRAELEAEVATLRSQASSPKPKAGIVRATLLSMKNIIEGAAGNVAATGLLAQLTPLLPGLVG